jgi:hypothetical protein
MTDQFYDANYEALKRIERERTERAVEGLTRKYEDQIIGENFLSGRLNSQGASMVRYIAREKALRKLEELGGEF